MILQSPLDPKIPIDSLHGMPDDGKQSTSELAGRGRDR